LAQAGAAEAPAQPLKDMDTDVSSQQGPSQDSRPAAAPRRRRQRGVVTEHVDHTAERAEARQPARPGQLSATAEEASATWEPRLGPGRPDAGLGSVAAASANTAGVFTAAEEEEGSVGPVFDTGDGRSAGPCFCCSAPQPRARESEVACACSEPRHAGSSRPGTAATATAGLASSLDSVVGGLCSQTHLGAVLSVRISKAHTTQRSDMEGPSYEDELLLMSQVTLHRELQELGSSLRADLSNVIRAAVCDILQAPLVGTTFDDGVTKGSGSQIGCAGNGNAAKVPIPPDKPEIMFAEGATEQASTCLEGARRSEVTNLPGTPVRDSSDAIADNPELSQNPCRDSNRRCRSSTLSKINGKLFGWNSDEAFNGSNPLDEIEERAEQAPENANAGEGSHSLRWRIKQLVEDLRFDYFFGILIVLNAVSIGVQADHVARTHEEDVPVALRVFDVIFCILFTSELSLRLFAYGHQFFVMVGWSWNWFDCILVGMQVFEEITAFVRHLTESHNSDGRVNLSFLRMVRILRLVRVIRLARVLRLVRQLRTLVCSIGASLQSLAWTVLLIMFMIYVVAIYFTQLVATRRIDLTEEQKQSDNIIAMSFYYGSLLRSCLSLFQAISGGVDWDNALHPLIQEVSVLIAPVFTFYIAFAILAMLNVVTGVFVESALQSTSQDKEENLMNHLQEFFFEMDLDKDGLISLYEFDRLLANPETRGRFASLDINLHEARNMFILLDVDKTEEVPIDCFVMACLRLRGPARSIDLTTLIYEQKHFQRMWQQHAANMEANLLNIDKRPPFLESVSLERQALKFQGLKGQPVHVLEQYVKSQ